MSKEESDRNMDTDYDKDIPCVVRDIDSRVDEMKGQFEFELDYLRVYEGLSQGEIAGALGEIDSLDKIRSPQLTRIGQIVAIRLEDVIITNNVKKEVAEKALDEVRIEYIMSHVPRLPNLKKTKADLATEKINTEARHKLLKILHG